MPSITNDRRTHLTVGAGPQTVYTYDFDINDADDIEVWVIDVTSGTGVPTQISTRTASSSPASGEFYVDPGFPTTKEVTLNSADVVLNDEVTILGRSADSRTATYATDGDFEAATVNTDLDYLLDLITENAAELARCVRKHPGEQDTVDLRVPMPLEAGNYLRLNTGGTALEWTSTTSGNIDVEDLEPTDGTNQQIIQHNGTVWTAVTNYTTSGDITTTGKVDANNAVLQGTAPNLLLSEDDGLLNEKAWFLQADAGQLVLNTKTDVLGAGENIMVVERTGTTVDSVTFKAESVAASSINSAIAGSGLSYTSGVLAVTGGASGVGDVVGPASATDNAVVRFDTTTGKLVQDSTVTVDDSGNMDVAGTLQAGSGNITLTNATGNILLAALEQDGASTGQFLAWDGADWAPGGIASLTGPISVTGGTLTVETGGITVDAGGLTVTAGNVDIDGGNLEVDGNITTKNNSATYLLIESDKVGLGDVATWAIQAADEGLDFKAFTDDLVSNENFMEVERTAQAIDTVTFPNGNVQVSEDLVVTGYVQAQDGSAADPGLTFGGITSGLFNRSGSEVNVSVNSDEILRVDGNGIGVYASGTVADIHLGINDSKAGRLWVYGDNATQGAKQYMYNAASEDATGGNPEYFVWEANGENLKLGDNGASELFKFSGDGDFEADGHVFSNTKDSVTAGSVIALGASDIMNMSGSTTIDRMTGGSEGMKITMIFGDAVTINHNTAGDGKFLLRSGTTAFGAFDATEFVCTGTSPNTVWWQVGG